MSRVTFKNTLDMEQYLGKEIGTSDWMVVSQERIAQFAEATNDFQWIHLDEARAQEESPFGTTIAHGFLVLSLLPHFFSEIMEFSNLKLMINYGMNKVRFMAPVPAGARIRMKVTLTEFVPSRIGKKAVLECRIELEGSKKAACLAENILLLQD